MIECIKKHMSVFITDGEYRATSNVDDQFFRALDKIFSEIGFNFTQSDIRSAFYEIIRQSTKVRLNNFTKNALEPWTLMATTISSYAQYKNKQEAITFNKN